MNNESFKHIVVGIDFSKYSKTVVKEAQKLAETMRIPLTYVFISTNTFKHWGAQLANLKIKLKNICLKPIS